MALNIKSLGLRTFSGVVYVALIVAALLSSPLLPKLLLFSFMVGVMVVEFNLLTKVNRLHPFRTTLDLVASIWLLVAIYLYGNGYDPRGGVFLPYFSYLFYIVGRTIFSDQGRAITTIGNVLTAQLYTVWPMAIALFLSFIQPIVVLCIFILIWVNDTAAYLVGSTLGRHKLYPSVSPKKSVEGLVGGLVASTVAVLFTPFFFSELSSMPLGILALFGVIVAVMATLGDLFESVLKRQAGVKDSGKIIPGHGGMLDRLDSFLFALPAGAIFYFFVMTHFHEVLY